ncbi:MAG: DUF6228 family protein [Limnobacter sp.]|uniref:DUF6228 family protein n=1 Tax=Limnobacter sp. TaxID=2003368 RepID=UPI00391CF6ED
MDEPAFSIRSNSSNRVVVFSGFNRDHETLRIDINGHGISVGSTVSVYTDAFGLDRYFKELAGISRPWSGARNWGTIENDFSISATSTSLGEVTFRISLCALQGAPEEWRVEVGLTADFGQLPKFAAVSGTFFNESVT